MEFLLSHWHCILPVVGIAVAMFLMRNKNKEKKDGHHTLNDTAVVLQNDKD